jgi:hypothetical protein
MARASAVEHAVELLCNKGCRRVWGEISALERGEVLPETRSLTPEERLLVLIELKAIMAVYGERCSVD